MEIALKEIFPRNNFRRSPIRGCLNLALDTSSADQDFPRFLAYGALSEVLEPNQSVPCHPRSILPIKWQPPPPPISATDIVAVRLPIRFADVLCIFADDYGGLGPTASIIKNWASLASQPSSSQSKRSTILVIVSGLSECATLEAIEMQTFRDILGRQDGVHSTKNCFSIKVVKLSGQDVSSLARYRRLKEIILDELDRARATRAQAGLLFSAIHLPFLYCQALQLTVRTWSEKFDVIQASRARSPVNSSLSEHLLRLMKVCSGSNVSTELLCKFVATALLVDAFPPQMHSEFDRSVSHAADTTEFNPSDLFDTLYDALCFSAADTFSNDTQYAVEFTTTVKAFFIQLSKDINGDTLTSINVRRQFLRDSFPLWRAIRTNATCLFCTSQKPEHSLACGHAMCDKCLMNFGEMVPAYDYRFSISSCLLCNRTLDLVAKIKPPTAGIRILTIDGGGICGVIPLEFLQLLQRLLGSELPLQDLFDAVFGTSSGNNEIQYVECAN